MTLAIGIDFGNQNTYVSIPKTDMKTGQLVAEVFANETGDRFIPSIVSYFHSRSEPVVGLSAKNNIIRQAAATILSSKRLLGVSDIAVASKLSSEIGMKSSGNNELVFSLPGVVIESASNEDVNEDDELSASDQRREAFENEIKVSAVDACVEIIKMAQAQAEVYTGVKVTHSVVSVPAYFNEAQCKALEHACKLAKLPLNMLIKDPVAVILAHIQDHINTNNNSTGCVINSISPMQASYVVIAMGASGTEVSLVQSNSGLITLVGSCRNEELAGFSFVRKLMQICASHFYEKHRLNITESKRAVAKLRVECERILQNLSSATVSTASIESLMDGIDLRFNVERATFEELAADIIEAYNQFVKSSVSSLVKLATSASIQFPITSVILVGGPSKIPLIHQATRSLITELVASKTLPLVNNENPKVIISATCDEIIANGAAIQASIIQTNNTGELERATFADKCQFASTNGAIGIVTISETTGKETFLELIPQNTPFPVHKSVSFKSTVDADKAACIRIAQADASRPNTTHLLCEVLVHPSTTPEDIASLDLILIVEKNNALTIHIRDLAKDSLLFSSTL